MNGRAQYLLRFDDLCPTFSRKRWERFRPLIEEMGIRPILGVVPDNRDPDLMVAEPATDFWPRMRVLEGAGATIGLHGWQHLCRSMGRSLVGLPCQTEFAGVEEEIQLGWIENGLSTLRNEGLNPTVWVAPRHGTDDATLRALRCAGIDYVSDGLARVPFVRNGVSWIPQQLWGPEEHWSGLWTICIHSNVASDEEVDQLSQFVKTHGSQFTCFERVVEEYRFGCLGAVVRIDAALRATRRAIRAGMKDLWACNGNAKREPSGVEIGFEEAGRGRELPSG